MKVDCIPGDKQEDGRCICVNCGRPFTCEAHRNCISPEAALAWAEKQKAEQITAEERQQACDELGITLEHAAHYEKALVKWWKAGRPKRTTEEIEQIHETCCKTCDDNINGRCKHCGCNVSKSEFTILNKIKMKTETCKLGKWPKDL